MLARPLCRNVSGILLQILEDFARDLLGGFSGTFSHKNEEKKAGDRNREKNQAAQKEKSAKNPFCQKPTLKNVELSFSPFLQNQLFSARGKNILPAHPAEARKRVFSVPLRAILGRTPKGAYSPRGRSGHLLETHFSEPLLRTLLRTLSYCEIHSRPNSQKPSENPFPEPFPEPSQNPNLRTLCCRTPP